MKCRKGLIYNIVCYVISPFSMMMNGFSMMRTGKPAAFYFVGKQLPLPAF